MDSTPPPLDKIPRAIIIQSISCGASEVHLVPDAKGYAVWYQIGEDRKCAMTIPKHLKHRLAAAFKDLFETEHSLPQEVVMPVRHDGKLWDLILTCSATHRGDHLVFRIVPMEDFPPPFPKKSED